MNISLGCANVVDEHARLCDLGVDAEVLRVGPDVPPMFQFQDPDGNVLQVVETT